MRNNIKILLLMIIIISTCTVFNYTNVNANSSSWTLRYIQHAESSANITIWTSTVTTTQSTLTGYVTKVGGEASVFIYSDNGIASTFKGAGSTTISTYPTRETFLAAQYANTGTYNSFPTGYFKY